MQWTQKSRVKIAGLNAKEQPDWNWSSFQLAKSTPPQCVIDYAIAPSARMDGMLKRRPFQVSISCASVTVVLGTFVLLMSSRSQEILIMKSTNQEPQHSCFGIHSVLSVVGSVDCTRTGSLLKLFPIFVHFSFDKFSKVR